VKAFKYQIKLLDPLFYAREGLSGAYTPPYLHSTAINFAFAFAISENSKNQPYITSEKTGGENTPRYENSIASDRFYFTPARITGNLKYQPEIAKADGDKFISLRYGAIKFRGKSMGKHETLKAYKLFFISSETVFEGYGIADENIAFPSIIRLGSFRGKAELNLIKEYIIKKNAENIFVEHPVDPLITNVFRGVMVNLLPYPIIDNAIVENGYEIKEDNINKFITFPMNFKINIIKPDKHTMML